MNNTQPPENHLPPQELAKHLRKPDGEIGKVVGTEMNKHNRLICLNSYSLLAPENHNHILEIGMGNGFYINELLKQAEDLSYIGVDYSSTMVEEAKRLNSDIMNSSKVDFVNSSLDDLNLPNDSFDRITTTNTIYFWPSPENNMKRLVNLLKPNGKLLIAYRPKACMSNLEVTRYNFTMYTPEIVEQLAIKAGFQSASTETINEPDLVFEGKTIKLAGHYTVCIK